MKRANVAVEIMEQAGLLFDVTGVTLLPNGSKLLILGLESTEKRDLDDFGHTGEVFRIFGFEEHVAPRLESVLQFIRSKGFSAEPVGKYGYPLRGEINLKMEAIRAGLGRRGKSAVVLHPEYGPRLRFLAVRTDATLQPATGRALAEEENPVCEDCSICIDICPTKVLEPYHMTDPWHCLSNINPVGEDGHSILCDECLHQCPAVGKKAP
jgi:epoxyqueuosine reductase QueG